MPNQSGACVCTPERCAYDNFACPHGCPEVIELDTPATSGASRLDEFFSFPWWKRAWLYFTKGYWRWLNADE